MMDDRELLREYVGHHSDQAFRELVARHLPCVLGTALRLVREPQSAADVAQLVFIQLARKAWTIREGQALSGWLYRVTHHTALKTLRTELRRRDRETTTMKLAETQAAPEPSWDDLAPLVDEALQQLKRGEQDALLLRFFEDKSYGEVGRILGLDEKTACQRVNRALEKMRQSFSRRGVTTTAALLGTALTSHAASSVPVGLVAHISVASLAGAGGSGALSGFILKTCFMSITTKSIIVAAVVIAASVASYQMGVTHGLHEQVLKGFDASSGGHTVAQTARNKIVASAPVALSGEVDFPQLLADLEKLPRGQQTEAAYRNIFQMWGSHDSAAALAAALALPIGPERIASLEGVAEGWAQLEPKAALDWAAGLPTENADALKAAMLVVAPSDPTLAALYLDKLTDVSARNETISIIVSAMTKKDPAAALDWLDKMAAGVTYDNGLKSIFSALGQRDPQAASQLLNQLSQQSDRDIAIAAMAQGMGQADPKTALAWIQSLPDSDSAARNNALRSIMANWSKSDVDAVIAFVQSSPDQSLLLSAAPSMAQYMAQVDAPATLAWAQSLPDGATKNQTLNAVLLSIAASDFDTAWNDVSNLPAGAPRDSAMNSLVGVLVKKDPAQAAGLVDQLSTVAARQTAARAVASNWGRSDPAATSMWLDSLPAGGVKNAATVQFVTAIADRDPAMALTWAQTIAYAPSQFTSIQTAITSMAKKDPAAAKQAVDSLQSVQLTGAQRNILNLAISSATQKTP